MHHWLWLQKYSLHPPIKKVNEKFYIHLYENLGLVSKGFYIKEYKYNWCSWLLVSFNAHKSKYIIQDHHGHQMHHFSR